MEDYELEQLDDFYKMLLMHRDNIDKKVNKGKIDPYKAHVLVEKLNEWYENHPIYLKNFGS